MGGNSLGFSVLLILTVLWRPALTDKCSIQCGGSSSSPSFLNGHTYNYGVEGTVSVYLSGADKQETNVKIFGQVSVSAFGNCAHSLKVNALAISGPDGKKYQPPKNIEKVVRFSFENGRVGSEICAEEDDNRASLNIKRAIISLLQTEQKPSTQIDVFGECPTDASSSQEGNVILVHRRRDLSRCAHREQSKNDLVTAIYNPSSEIKNSQILMSSLQVESKVNNGVPEKVSASEDYTYRPFSAAENGARASVNTKLTLSAVKSGAGEEGNCPVSRTILFEIPHQGRADHSSAQNVVAAIKETCKELQTEAGSKSAGVFANLVRVMRATNKEDLMKVFGQVKGNSLEKRVYLDALFRTGTGYSIEASIQILRNKQLNTFEEKLVFLSLGNAKHVNSDTIKAAVTLLDIPNVPKEIYLGVGALAGVYCKAHECHTSKTEGILALSKKFAAKLQNCKPKTKIDEDYVIAVLKGIRNIRHLEDNLIDKLTHCANDNGVKARVRVAVLEAFQADPCSAKIKKTGLALMKNRQLDSEIRIKAYLSVISCPCGKSANEIKSLLDSEPVHQVGRFITTSLRHIRASTNPDKLLARQHYGQIGTPSKFKVDDRKYSFYREFSYNVDALGVGGNLEESVIYSQDSFLPRSVNFNLTAELFGHNVNIFEIGGRQGNLDRFMEHFVGPKGTLRTRTPQEIYDALMKQGHEAFQKVDNKLRGRRSIKTDVDHFDKQIKAESTPYNNELDLDVYLKLFGSDAVFLSLGDDQGFNFDKGLDQILHWVNEGMNKIKHFQQEVRAHVLFLDAELSYPTSTGLPLKLDVVGAATGRVDVSTNIDLKQIFRTPENAKVDIKVVPSSDIEITMVMMVDAYSVGTGLKGVLNLHSSTGGHVIAKVINNFEGFDLQLGLPVDKQEILTASNELVFFSAELGRGEKQTPIKVDLDKKDYSGCFDQLSGMLGLTMCGEFSVPFTFTGPEAQDSIAKFLSKYPVVGPSKIRLSLEKNDLKGYHIKGLLKNDGKNNRHGFEVLFDAEGSQNRRTQVSGEYVNNSEEKTVEFSLESPIKTVYGQISLYTKPSETALLVKAKMDQMQYYGKVGFNAQGNDRRRVWKPVLEYEMPENGKQNLKVDGQLIQETNGPSVSYTLEGIKVNLPQNNEVVTVEGHFNKEPQSMNMDLKAKKGQHNLIFSGSLKGSDVKLDFQNTLNPFVNFKLNGHFENTNNLLHNDIDLYYGSDLNNNENRVTFNQLLKWADATNVITKNRFDIYALPLKLQFDLEYDPKKIDLEMLSLYIDRKFHFDLDARTHIKKPEDYRIKMVTTVDKQTVEVFMKRDIVSADKSNLENYVNFKNVAKYELSGVLLHRVKENDLNVGAVGHVKISSSNVKEDINFDVGIIENEKLYSTHINLARNKDLVLLDLLAKVNRGANPSGQLKFNLKDTVSANGQYQVTDNSGKGNGAIIVEFKKIQRKIKSDVNFVVKAPVYNADVTIFLNFEKDDNDKIIFTTNTKRDEKIINSQNKLEYGGKITELNINVHNLEKVKGSVEMVLPTERCLTLKFNKEIVEKDGLYNGQDEISLSDAAKRGGPESIIVLKAKTTDTDFEDKFNVEGSFEMKLKEGKDLVSNFVIKNTPNGDKFDSVFKADLSGSLMPKRAVIDSSWTYKSAWTIDDTYHAKASYGDDLSTEIVGTWISHFPESGDNKYLDDFTWSFRLPFEKAYDIKWTQHFLYLHPENQQKEITLVQAFQVNGDLYKIDGSGKYGNTDGTTKVKVIVPHNDPLVFDVGYKADFEGDVKNGKVDFKIQYGKGKNAELKLKGTSSQRNYELNIFANAPHFDKFKKIDIQLRTEKSEPSTYSSWFVMDVDGRVYKSENKMTLLHSSPMIDFTYTGPEKPEVTSRMFMKGINLQTKHSRVEVKLLNFRKLDLDVAFEVGFEKDIVMKFEGTSATLGLKNYRMDIATKDGKRLEFEAVNDGKNILSGSTSFIKKEEDTKIIIEGSGTLKVRDTQKPANFKFIRTILTEGAEQGVETFINVAVGERNHVAESRITNLEYKSSFVYCEEKKQCAHAELHSKLNINQPGVLQHTFVVGLDLRKLGFATEFGLEISNELSDKMLPQYLLNLHVNREADKIHLNVYSKPEPGKFPAGLTMALSKRVFVVETLVQYPTDKSLPFPISGELNLYPDKNKPETKTSARFLVDLKASENNAQGLAEVGFSHPKLRKEALVRVKGDYQQPSDSSVKISTSSLVSHPILGQDRKAEFNFEASPTHLKLLVDTPIVNLIDLEGSSIMKENLQQADIRFKLLEGKPVTMYAVVKDFSYYEFTTGYADEHERKLSITGNLNPEKRVDVSVDIVLPGAKKNIVHGALFLQDNAIKSTYGLSQDNYNHFIGAFQKDVKNLISKITELNEKSSNDFKQVLKRIEPKLKEMEQTYRDEFQKIIQEITDDKTIKELSEALYILLQTLAKITDEVVTATKPIVDKCTGAFADIAKKTCEMYDKQIEPQLKQLYQSIGEAVQQYLNAVIDVVSHVSALFIDFYEKHKPEVQELINTFSDIFKDITRVIYSHMKEWRSRASQVFSEIQQQFKDMPLIAMIKEKWLELAVPEQALAIIQDAQQAIRAFLPTEELKQFTDVLFRYVNMKVRQEKMDEQAELKVVYEKLVLAITSMLNFVRSNLNQFGITSLPVFSMPSLSNPTSFVGPSFGGSMGWSLVTQLLNGDIPDPLAVFNAYRPRFANPLNEIPGALRGVVVNGQHIFTFDGRHLTFPGTCRYVLAHDHVDRNFTLAIQLQNGKPKAIIHEDKNGDVIEIKDNGQVFFNNVNHGYPVIEKGSYAFKQANGALGVESSYGLGAYCTSKLEVCYIQVSGFYLGKLRGLLGDGNNEPYDDFRLPNGKIVTSESDFGNAYRLTGSCAAVKTPEHSHHQMHMALPPACEAVFGGTSPLRPLSLLLDMAPYRQACIHAVSGLEGEAANEQACFLARGYTNLAKSELLPVLMPASCLKCTDGDTPRNIGDVYEFKVPAKQADIIIAVEATKSNEQYYKDLVVPLVSQVIDGLKAKRISDIKVYLVGVTEKYGFATMYDTDLKLQKPKMRFTDTKRYQSYDKYRVITGIDTFNKLQDALVSIADFAAVKLGATNVMAAYNSIFTDIPIRPGAVKHFISAVSEYCEPQLGIVEQLRALQTKIWNENNVYSVSLITKTAKLEQINGKPVVGFSKEGVLLLGDKKQKDTKAQRANLDIGIEDGCINIAQESDGYVFSASEYENLDAGHRKQFLQTAAASITGRMLQNNIVQECTCSYRDSYTARSLCITKDRK